MLLLTIYPESLFKILNPIELHSMLLTISPFMFWDDPKTFLESILYLLVFWLEIELQDCYLQCVRTLANNVLEP